MSSSTRYLGIFKFLVENVRLLSNPLIIFIFNLVICKVHRERKCSDTESDILSVLEKLDVLPFYMLVVTGGRDAPSNH